jgi:hypothetical protein
MKAISNILMILMAACGLACAQAKSGSGFVHIINAVAAGSGKAAFAINGRDLFDGGYALGQTTGEYAVKTGDLVITIRKTGVETGRTNIQLKDGETVTLIAFAEQVPQKDLSAPPKWAVRLLRLWQEKEAENFTLSLVSVCKAEETAVDLLAIDSGKLEKSFARRLAVTKVDIDRKRGEIFVKAGDRVLATVAPDSPGNYVVILHDNQEGVTEAVSYYDLKLLNAG